MAANLKPASITASNRIRRLIWSFVFHSLYRYSPNLLHPWRRMLLRLFGAKIGPGAHPYPRTKIWAPWNLIMKDDSCLANDVDCYNVSPITIGRKAVVSQYSFLCSASHDYETSEFQLLSGPISIGPNAWVGADAFIGPGVAVGEGAIVAARATVVRDVQAWTVVAGNPARIVKTRENSEQGLRYAARERTQ